MGIYISVVLFYIIMNNKKYVWLKKKEYVKAMDRFSKFLYYLGILKQKRWRKAAKEYCGTKDTDPDKRPYQIYSGIHYSSVFGLRWWNPLTWIFISICLIIGIAKTIIEAFQDIDLKNDLEIEVHVNKKLIEKNNYD